MNLRIDNVVENTNFPHAQPILRTSQAAKTLDPTLTHLLRLISKMFLDRVTNLGSNPRSWKISVILFSFGREDDLVSQSGQMLARIIAVVQR